MSKASALIYTREKYIGFPGERFKVQPEDFPTEVARDILTYAMSAMEDVKHLRSAHKQVQVVIAKNGYVTLGIAAYLRDMFSDGWEGKDEANRLGYGFFGYVWKQETFSQNVQFPTLEAYATLVAEYIRPNWEMSPNSRWAAHQELVPYRYVPCNMCTISNNNFTPSRIEPVENRDRLLHWAIQRAANGETVSVCTNVTIYDMKDYKTPFQYLSLSASDQTPCSVSIPKQKINTGTTSTNSNTSEKISTDPTVGSSAIANRTNDYCKHDSQKRKTGKTKLIALLTGGVGLLAFAALPLPTTMLRGVLLVIAIICVAIGIVNIALTRKSLDEPPALNLPTIPKKKETTGPIGINPFKAEPNASENPARPTMIGNQKSVTSHETKKETTEDLFRF